MTYVTEGVAIATKGFISAGHLLKEELSISLVDDDLSITVEDDEL